MRSAARLALPAALATGRANAMAAHYMRVIFDHPHDAE
jgi:hypothetical protein